MIMHGVKNIKLIDFYKFYCLGDELNNNLIHLNEVILLCIYIFTLLLYIAVNTTIIEYNTNATCFDLQ